MPNKYHKYFKILELDIQASKEDVKKAFSELSHIWHPDNYMGKPSNIQDRATRKFKKISTAYQVLNEYLGEEDSDSYAEEKTKAEQERRVREEKERKQREENERLKREREEKERKQREENERLKREREEKERKQREENERLKKEEEIRWGAGLGRWVQEEKEKANRKHQEEKSKKKNTAQDSEFSWWRDFWSWALILPLLVMVLTVLVPWIEEWTADIGGKVSHKVVGNTNPKTNGNKISQPESLSWKRSFRGEIIDRQGLTLNLERNGDNFIGHYIDVHEMKKKILIGKFDNKFPRNLVLDEYVDGKKSGSFYGNYTAGKGINGEYISQSEPNNKLKFKLKEIDAPIDESRKTTNSHFFEQGLKAYKNKDYKKALEILQPLAEQGNDAAQYILGLMYQNGQGVLQDYKEAVKWFRLSAEQGNAEAQFFLGGMYDEGKGVPQDYKEAVRLYRLSAEQEDASAQFDVGVMYALGRGIPKDYKEAVKWFRLSAEQGLSQAQYIIGLMYKEGKGVPQDYVLAYMWLSISIANGDKDAVTERNIAEKTMSKQQIEKAQELARNWKPTKKGETDELKKMLEYSPPLEISEEETKPPPKAAPLESNLDLPIANPLPDEDWRPAYEVPLTGPYDEMEEEVENLFKDSDSWTEQ